MTVADRSWERPRDRFRDRARTVRDASRALAALLALSPLALAAGTPSASAAETVVSSLGAEAGSRKIDITIGRSLVVDLPRDAREVFVANPKVANAVVRSTRKLFVIGIENGATSIVAMDSEGRQIVALDVTVGRDLNVLRETLRSSLPSARFDVRPAGDSVLLTGQVASASEAQQAIDIANAFVGAQGGLFGGAKGAVINNITVRGKDQVMLRVTVAEVSRTVLKQFGINTSGSWQPFNSSGVQGSGTYDVVNPFPLSTNPPGVLSGSLKGGGFNIGATLRAFERAGVSRILAEPTLTAISGEAAKFTAGGEIPVPTSQSCTAALVGSGTNCVVGIEYKPYGVTLNFTPIVYSENRISIRVGTDVTELDPQKSIGIANGGSSIAVPGTTVRRSETTVELPSGAVMMTAGLIQQRSQQAINGLPGLINLPILGALFRSRDYQREETELMIMVSPFIAKPMEAAQVQRPDDGYTEANDAQSLLLGRFNRLYGTAGAPPLGNGYKGRFGFITD